MCFQKQRGWQESVKEIKTANLRERSKKIQDHRLEHVMILWMCCRLRLTCHREQGCILSPGNRGLLQGEDASEESWWVYGWWCWWIREDWRWCSLSPPSPLRLRWEDGKPFELLLSLFSFQSLSLCVCLPVLRTKQKEKEHYFWLQIITNLTKRKRYDDDLMTI